MEKCWKKYIDEMLTAKQIKIEEDDDDENINFETVEMVIEPVDPCFDVDDYLYIDTKPDINYDGGSNYDSLTDFDEYDDNSRVMSIPPKVHDCQYCNETGLSRTELRIHQQNDHPEMLVTLQLKCDICGKIYSSRYGIRTHMKRHIQIGSTEVEPSKKIKRYKCTTCNETFNKKVQLAQHELLHSGVSKFEFDLELAGTRIGQIRFRQKN